MGVQVRERTSTCLPCVSQDSWPGARELAGSLEPVADILLSAWSPLFLLTPTLTAPCSVSSSLSLSTLSRSNRPPEVFHVPSVMVQRGILPLGNCQTSSLTILCSERRHSPMLCPWFGPRTITGPPPLPKAIMSLVPPYQGFKRQASWSEH